jgi:SAM-dependent methyltransferase
MRAHRAHVTDSRPRIVNPRADLLFSSLAERRGLDPDARFVGGYVEWEWRHARHVFDGPLGSVRGRRVLELGCNVGATAIVLGALGAEVVAIDPDAEIVEIARANVARYGLVDRVTLAHVADTTRLPFERESFDWVSCNSVLEYVPHEERGAVLGEVDRVLVPSGRVAILGTSNQLWPVEQHSQRWLAHYLPRALDGALFERAPRRGVTASFVRRTLAGYRDLAARDGGQLFVDLKARMGARGAKLAMLRAGARIATRAGAAPGCLGPTLTMILQKP